MISFLQSVLVFCWILFAFVWLVAATATKHTNHILPNQWWWREGLVIGIGALYVLTLTGNAPFLLHPLFIENILTSLTGSVFALSGLCMLLWSRYKLGRNWSEQITLKEDHELVTTGPYAFVRHPIYTGLFALLLASVVIVPMIFVGITSFMIIVSFCFKARAEEILLLESFPQEYNEYRKKVKAIIPFVV